MKYKVPKIKIWLSSICIVLTTLVYSQNPNWQQPVSSGYTFTSSLISIVQLSDIRSNNADDRVAFFVGGELRGLSKPVLAGPNLYIHFVTIYANQAVEMMDVKIYHKTTNIVYELVNPFNVVAQNIVGSVDVPYIINAYPDNDAPISILNVPNQQTIEGLAFQSIDMNTYLVQPDPFDVAWSYTPNPNLIVNLVDGILNVEGEPGYVGTTSLVVTATELETAMNVSNGNTGSRAAQPQSAQTTISFNIAPLYDGPAWNPIPNQGIVAGSQFDTFDLDDYEYQYAGPYLEYGYYPIVEESMNPVLQPSWSMDSLYKNTMNIIAKVVFTPNYVFTHANDVLIAEVNGQIRGLARRDPVSNLYFITIGGSNTNDVITFQFYSGLKKEILTLQGSLTYRVYDVLGSPDVPLTFDFAPLRPSIDINGVTTMEIIDTAWIGLQDFAFTAADSLYPTYLYAERIASFCVVEQLSDLVTLYQDADGDGLGNPAVSIVSCLGAEGYVTNNGDCDDTNPVDPTLVVLITEISGQSSNDGYICPGSPVTIAASGGLSYLWSNGATTATITVNPITTTIYTVSMTNAQGCQGSKSSPIYVEGTVITQSGNDGFGSLRQVFNCITEGGTITFDQPTISTSVLDEQLIITKNVIIKGLNATSKPSIYLDYLNSNSGLRISQSKALQLDNTDIRIINNSGSLPTVSGKGELIIKNKTVVK